MRQYFKDIKDICSCITNQDILEYACYVGHWWDFLQSYNPKQHTAFDPYNPSEKANLAKELSDAKQKHPNIKYYNIGYENYVGKHDVVICAGLIYKLSSPFHLLEDIVARQPHTILIENFGSYKPLNSWKKMTLDIKNSENIDMATNRNTTTPRLPWYVLDVEPGLIENAFNYLNYQMTDFITTCNKFLEFEHKNKTTTMMNFEPR